MRPKYIVPQFLFVLSILLLIHWVDSPKINELKVLNILFLISLVFLNLSIKKYKKMDGFRLFLALIFPILMTILIIRDWRFIITTYLTYLSLYLLYKEIKKPTI